MRYNTIEFENGNYKSLINVFCDECGCAFKKRYSFVKYSLVHKENSKAFCTSACKFAYRTRGRVKVNCLKCSEVFEKPTSGCDSHQKFCSKSCAAVYNNNQRSKNNPKPIKERKRFSERHSLQCKECNTEFVVIHCQRHRKFCCKACAGKHNYHPDTTKATRCYYRGVNLDSGAELAFAQLLDRHCITWTKNQSKFYTFIDDKSKERKYYPDFYLPDYNFWVEIKGKRYIRKDDPLRLAAVGNIELIMSDNIRLPSCVNRLH